MSSAHCPTDGPGLLAVLRTSRPALLASEVKGGCPIGDTLTDEQATELAAALLGRPVASASQVPASAEHQVFRIQCRGLIAFLKIAEGVYIESELAVLELLAARGVPVPVIEAADPDGAQTGFPCALIRHIGGSPLTHDSPEFATTGKILHQVHDITLTGYGPLTSGPAGLRGQHATWHDALELSVHGLEPIAAAGLVDPALLARAITAVEENTPALNTPKPGRLRHGDFHPRHVYADGSHITGIIDWGDASSGDPLYDFGRILHSAVVADDLRFGIEVVSAVTKSYGDAPWLQGDPIKHLLAYGVVFSLSSMHSEFVGGAPWPPWSPAQAAALTAMLDAF
jgi:Ser/Thr protein kinase RdoA (MazF antagonist)